MTTEAPPAWEFTTLLGAGVYRVRAQWNTRFRFWTVDLLTAAGAPIYLGRKLVLGEALYEHSAQPGLPVSQVFAAAPSGAVERIEREDLGVTVPLYLVPSNAV